MNNITLSGTVLSKPEFSHELHGEKFYRFALSSRRTSGTEDKLSCIVPQIFLKKIGECGDKISITGEIRTRNSDGHLIIFVFVRNVVEYDEDKNTVFIDGFICKEPNFRETPLGRQVCDLLVASNRPYGKSDYIPCIVWGRKAIEASEMPMGREVMILGRLQSRQYEKVSEDGSINTKTAFEVSVSNIEVVGKGEESEGHGNEN